MTGHEGSGRRESYGDAAGQRTRWRPRYPEVSRPHSGPLLGAYVKEHLGRKRASRACSPRWLACVEVHLAAAVAVLGARTPLRAINARAVEVLLAHLLARSNGRGGTLRTGTVHHYLNSLSNLFRRAEGDGLVERNPVKQLLDVPAIVRTPTPWLEIHEVSRVLDAARAHRPARPDRAMPFLFELVATFAYTGVRTAEGLGLRVGDVRLDRGVLLVRPNHWRGLKTGEAEREVPIFSELTVILGAYLRGSRAPSGDLLFPSPQHAQERPLRNLTRAFDQLPMPERLQQSSDSSPRLRPRVLRHTYCAARLQTLDWGQPISPYTVARELGHTDLDMVLRIYGHLGRIRARSSEISFLVGGP